MFDLIPFDRSQRNLFEYFDSMQRDFFDSLTDNVSRFRTDIIDKGDRYLLQAELPGFCKEDIHIDLHENMLTISAKHCEDKKEKEDNKHHYVRHERRCGYFSRSFDVSGIATDQIQANYRNGLLELTLPKTDPQPKNPTRHIDIQ